MCEGQGGVLAQSWSRMEADCIGSRVGSGRLKERVALHWRTRWGFCGQAQMREDFGNDGGIFDGGDERQGAATIWHES